MYACICACVYQLSKTVVKGHFVAYCISVSFFFALFLSSLSSLALSGSLQFSLLFFCLFRSLLPSISSSLLSLLSFCVFRSLSLPLSLSSLSLILVLLPLSLVVFTPPLSPYLFLQFSLFLSCYLSLAPLSITLSISLPLVVFTFTLFTYWKPSTLTLLVSHSLCQCSSFLNIYIFVLFFGAYRLFPVFFCLSP